MNDLQEAEPIGREDLTRHYGQNKDLRSLCLRDGKYASIQLAGARLDGMNLRRTVLQDANLNNSQLVDVVAVRAILTAAKLNNADLRNADLRDAQLLSADLTGADVRGASFTPETNLKGALVQGLKIDRRALRMLGDSHGGLTAADLAALDVHDDQVKLTTSFGGFWSLVHLIAVTVFLLPYLAFAVRRYVAAQIVPCEPPMCTTLRQAIWNYIVTGGQGTQTDWLALGIFSLLLLYSVFRVSLVYKSRSLSLAEAAVGLPRQFVLRGYWWVAYYGCQFLFLLNLFLVLIHAYHLLDTQVHK